MSNRPLVLNFSASDSAGLAGMAMDIRSQSALGVHGLSVVTANTAQNNESVISLNAVADRVFDEQLLAVGELPFKAIKIGLLGSEYQCEKISALLAHISKKKIPVVLDPVLGSSSGASFSKEALVKTLLSSLLPVATLLTPNIIEAEALTGLSIRSHDDIVKAAQQLLAMGPKAVLIKGGHFQSSNADRVEDYFSDGDRSFWLSSPKVESPNSRGTGCALSSAIASALALGYSLYDAVVIGKMAISQGLRQSYALENASSELGESNKKYKGPVNITHFPDEQIDLPFLTQTPVCSVGESFTACNKPLLGLYPVVDSAKWIETLAASGVSTIQLRVKGLDSPALEQEIIEAIRLAKKYQLRLFINDYWRLAIQYGAYGVHLGQEDLDAADIQQIQQAGLRLGISTHCHYEVARAHAYQPSYIACGPVYHTKTKDMPWVPHGIEGLSYWRKVLQYPLVAIGGINRERFNGIAVSGVDSVAMITAITLANDPLKTAQDFVKGFNQCAQKKFIETSKASNE